MSQVKNLRAMFENKGDTSPPDRGRSPGVTPDRHIGDASSNSSPRPLSKVRTNFVAIEKDGRMGLRRDHSGESSLSRRMSMETADTESNGNFDNHNKIPSDDIGKAPRHNVASEAIPESSRTMSYEHAVVPVDAGSQVNKAHVEAKIMLDSHPHVQGEQEGTSAANAALQSASAMNHPHSIKHSGLLSSAQAIMTTTRPMKSTSTISVARPESKANNRALNFNKSSVDKNQKTNTGSTSSTKARTRPSGVAANNLPVKTKSQNDAGFIKPKPKSPTKPISMPSSLTAPTASSVSKVHAPRRPSSRPSGTQNNSSQHGTRSNMSSSTALQCAIKGQTPSSSKSRPSLGPPPNKQWQVTASQKRQSNIDEGFLARMMRPTQSSSSKTTDKAPLTPPNRTTQRLLGGEPGNQALSRSASSRGLQGKRIPVPASLESNSPPLTGRPDELGPLKPEEECNQFHADTNDRLHIANANADIEARSPSNPATQYIADENLSAAPEKPETLEAVTTTSTSNANSAVDDIIHNTRFREEADDSKASLSAGPTPLVELTQAFGSVESDETASKHKQRSVIEELDDVAPETTIEEQNCDADLVSETEKMSRSSVGDDLSNEKPVISEDYQRTGPVKVHRAEQHTREPPISHLDIDHPDEQGSQQLVRGTQKCPMSGANGPSPLEIAQANLSADKRDGMDQMGFALDEQKRSTVQDHTTTVEVALETKHT